MFWSPFLRVFLGSLGSNIQPHLWAVSLIDLLKSNLSNGLLFKRPTLYVNILQKNISAHLSAALTAYLNKIFCFMYNTSLTELANHLPAETGTKTE